MILLIKNETWYYVERLYLHVYGSSKFINFLRSFELNYDVEYPNNIHDFMKEHDHSIEDFMSIVKDEKKLEILKKIIFDTQIEKTQRLDFNYYGEQINAWYPKVVENLKSSNIDIDYTNETLIETTNLKLNLFLHNISGFIVNNLSDTNWSYVSEICGVTHILNFPKNEQLIRSHELIDSNYESHIYYFLKDVHSYNEDFCMLLIRLVGKQGTLNDTGKEKFHEILTNFEQNNWIELLIQNIKNPTHENLIDCEVVPDSFYRALANEINFQYITNHYIPLSILIRKIIENLIIDILRKKYGHSNMEMYYNINQGRFQDFSVLLRNLDSCKQDFKHVSSSFNDDLMRKIKKYKESGNSAAHSIDVNLTNDYFLSNKEEINYIINILIRVCKNLPPE
ncbi:hypothetical protein [Methanosarcina sp. 2.H.A.1B.4]|uniref:hypothetical protein n=1 Tax=Methanosarcina sp. 2.H.A.1B.4 TaxID=1483600 RepID=UPI000621EA07|nr:hypothetical protein [Methanosarcina sp. 2.H.A.1B.4]KKG10437.1 hypothetical protein EO92_05465 [Methanosarcina sp. 2.H.A.1B.4]